VSDVELVVLDDEEAAAAATAERLAEAARAGAQIALTGGSTPRRAYELAATREPDWSRAGAWWGDERCVPSDDERSNFRLARESLLDRLEHRPAVHRIRGELDPAEAAADYERELGDTVLDLVLLGLGPDGHVASLFPGAPTLRERKRRVVAAAPGLEPFVERSPPAAQFSSSSPEPRRPKPCVRRSRRSRASTPPRASFARRPVPPWPSSTGQPRRCSGSLYRKHSVGSRLLDKQSEFLYLPWRA